MTTNPHERRARTRKVRRLCRVVRSVGSLRFTPFELAYWVKRAGPDVRAAIAHRAGVASPSDETWARVVTALGRYRRGC
jgi:hypothetical protein